MSYSQGKVEVFGQIKSEMPDLKKAEIRIQEDNGIFQKLKFNRSGKFELALPIGHIYTIEFSQAGCITKQIEISTHCPETHQKTVFDPFHFSVLLETYSEMPAVDTLFYDRPVGKVYFEEDYEKFGYDREYILYVQNTIREAVERQFMLAMKRDNITDRLLASSTALSGVDSLGIKDKHIIEDFNPDSAVATVYAEDISTDSLTETLLSNQLTKANNVEYTESTKKTEIEIKTDSLPEPEVATRTALALAETTSSIQTTFPDSKEVETAETKAVQESASVSPIPKEELKKEPERKVKPPKQTILEEPARRVRPKENNYTAEPQFKKRPERKTFENSQYSVGLWTRIFINDGSRVTKYTMIQYKTGKTSYFKQDQHQTDSLQISRSIFMRVIK